MVAATFTTEVVPEHERAEYWQEVAGRVFLGLRTERKNHAPFFGTLDTHEVGSLPVTFLHSSAQDVYRGSPEIARAPRECFYVAMQLGGVCTIMQGGGVRHAHPGDIELLDGTRPGQLSFESDYRRLVIAVPYDQLRPRLVEPDRALRHIARGGDGLGALASNYLRTVAHTPLPAAVGPQVSELLVDLLALTFNAPVAGLDSDTPCAREARRIAIRQYVERNLSDPSLSPATVAARFRISTRYLHGLFSEQGQTFMRWLLSRRLARCRDAFADPALRHRSITEIAYAAGFHDLSHFGRAFKAAFGMSPRAFRAGLPPVEMRDLTAARQDLRGASARV
ncbi:MAG: helix-turn-helix domain-containing protein [Minicystis sp.]